MNAFFKLTVADLKEFVRNRTLMIITILVPVFFVAFFGMAYGGMSNGKFSVGLVVEDNSSLGQGFVQTLERVPAFSLVRGKQGDELAALRKGDRRAVIVVPSEFGAAMFGAKSDLTVYYDPSQPVAAQTILSVLREVTREADKQATKQPTLITLNEVAEQTHRLRDIDFLLPGILAMGLMWLGIFNAIPLVQKRQSHVLKRYNATPLSRTKMVAAQVVSRLLTSAVQAVLILAVGKVLFNVQNVGSWLLLALLVVAGTLVFVAIGYVIAAIARTEEAANGLSQLVNFPLMFLSGVFFPIDIMPSYLKPVVQTLPLTYLNDAFRQVMLQGVGASAVLLDLGVLAAWIAVCLAVSIRFFRWT